MSKYFRYASCGAYLKYLKENCEAEKPKHNPTWLGAPSIFLGRKTIDIDFHCAH